MKNLTDSKVKWRSIESGIAYKNRTKMPRALPPKMVAIECIDKAYGYSMNTTYGYSQNYSNWFRYCFFASMAINCVGIKCQCQTKWHRKKGKKKNERPCFRLLFCQRSMVSERADDGSNVSEVSSMEHGRSALPAMDVGSERAGNYNQLTILNEL